MSPHRDFDAARAERERLIEPETFTFGGETFTCVLAPALGDVLDLVDAPEPSADLAGAAKAMDFFIRKLLVPSDRERWDELLRSSDTPHGVINAYDVIEVGMHLSEVFGGRPTGPSTDSSRGRDKDGEDSSSPPGNGTGPTSPTSG
jgi:hypothetical protein